MANLTLNEALEQGIKAHKAGNAHEADRFYTMILQVNPLHADANHNMGVLAMDLGRPEEAIPFLTKALEANSDFIIFWESLAEAMLRAKKYPALKTILEQAYARRLESHKLKILNDKLQKLAGTMVRTTMDLPIAVYQKLKLLYEAESYEEVLLKITQLNDQYPNSLQLLFLQGSAQDQLGKSTDAIETYQKAISINANSSYAHYGLGVAFLKSKQNYDALSAFKKSAELDPNFPHAFFNIAVLMKSESNIECAIENYKKAIALKPDYAAAHMNIANIYQEDQKYLEAIQHYEQVVLIDENDVNARFSKGNCYLAQGHYEQAEKEYKEALKYDSLDHRIYVNLGITQKFLNKIDAAITNLSEAVNLKPDFVEALINLAQLLEHRIIIKATASIETAIYRILNHDYAARPRSLAKCIISLVKNDPAIAEVINSDLLTLDRENFSNACRTISNNRLLMKLMTLCALPDQGLEQILINVRYKFLKDIEIHSDDKALMDLQISLALNCYTNEYAFPVSSHEATLVNDLEKEIGRRLLNNQQPTDVQVLSLASYEPLHKFEWVSKLDVQKNLERVYQRQVVEPLYEEKIIPEIKNLALVTDDTSEKVRAQYEENPYPRWVNTKVNVRASELAFSNDAKKYNFRKLEDLACTQPVLLIAGCGTGQHAIDSATRYKDVSVTAIDLSYASLAYAIRKSAELGVTNINYMQGDILDVEKLGTKFDIIECSGVLHHMEQPEKAWMKLKSSLKPGGLMKIGLYSRAARVNIDKTRSEFNLDGLAYTASDLREIRNEIRTSGLAHCTAVTTSSDFYTLSEFRDLVLHVKEHTFDLNQIAEMMNRLELRFCGFTNSKAIDDFRNMNPNAKDLYNLSLWHQYEIENPQAFAGMYQFWCQDQRHDI